MGKQLYITHVGRVN